MESTRKKSHKRKEVQKEKSRSEKKDGKRVSKLRSHSSSSSSTSLSSISSSLSDCSLWFSSSSSSSSLLSSSSSEKKKEIQEIKIPERNQIYQKEFSSESFVFPVQQKCWTINWREKKVLQEATNGFKPYPPPKKKIGQPKRKNYPA